MLRPQNEALGFVVFIALFILDPEMESPKTSEAGNPELYPIFRFLPRYPKYASSYLFWSFQEGMLLISWNSDKIHWFVFHTVTVELGVMGRIHSSSK